MNKTIEKIVGLLFEDLEDSEEVRAIHEEICLNCQERYEDKLAMGLSEDEAIHAVVESLSGMEEMLRPYRRTEAPKPAEERLDAEEEAVRCFSFDPAQTPIHEIRAMRLGSTDVEIAASPDGLIHIDCEDVNTAVEASLQDGALLISLRDQPNQDSNGKWSAEINTGSTTLNNLLSNLLGGLMRTIGTNQGGGTMTLSIPNALRPVVKIETASGDLHASAMRLKELHFSTASGDLQLTDVGANLLRCSAASGDFALEHIRAEQLSLHSTSGDLHAEGMDISGDTHISTTSGDVHWTGESGLMEINTISGDVDRCMGSFNVVRFKTVSGDVSMRLDAQRLASLTGKTASGDMRLVLSGAPSLKLQCRSISGDVRSQLPYDPTAELVVELSSTSVDISIHG